MSNRYGVSIRAADAGDSDGIAELFRAAGAALDRRGLAKRLEAIRMEHGAALLASEWGPPSGIVVVTWSWTLTLEMKAARVTTLLVDPEQRRRGIARLLLKAASQAARSAGCGALSLSPPVGAHDLEAFCLATGFTASGATYVRPLRKQG